MKTFNYFKCIKIKQGAGDDMSTAKKHNNSRGNKKITGDFGMAQQYYYQTEWCILVRQYNPIHICKTDFFVNLKCHKQYIAAKYLNNKSGTVNESQKPHTIY